MGSVIDYISCPDCGTEAYNEFNYKTGEEYISCNACGYFRRFYITNLEEQGKPQLEGLPWLPEFKIEETHGCGAYKLKPKGFIGYECGSFTQPESEWEFISLVEARKDEIEHAEYTTFVDGVLNKIVLIEGDLYNDVHPETGESNMVED